MSKIFQELRDNLYNLNKEFEDLYRTLTEFKVIENEGRDIPFEVFERASASIVERSRGITAEGLYNLAIKSSSSPQCCAEGMFEMSSVLMELAWRHGKGRQDLESTVGEEFSATFVTGLDDYALSKYVIESKFKQFAHDADLNRPSFDLTSSEIAMVQSFGAKLNAVSEELTDIEPQRPKMKMK